MAIIPKHELKKLMENRSNPSISIYMPTFRAGTETQQGAIRLKNLIQKTRQLLLDQSYKHPEINELLNPIENLDKSPIFWNRQIDGLAIFRTQSDFFSYSLPLRFEERTVINDRFYIKPLLSLLSGDGQFYILALSQNVSSLLKGSRFSVQKIGKDELPQGLAQTLKIEELEAELQYHSTTKYPGRGDPSKYHGHGYGAVEEDKTEHLRQYFRAIDQALTSYLDDKKAPLILAGVEYLLPIYKEVSKYSLLIPDGIKGNPENISPGRLHQLAWEIAEPHFQKDLKEALEKFYANLGTGQISLDIKEIAPASRNGQVERLFIAQGAQIWGAYNPDTNTINLEEGSNSKNHDLLNWAAAHTFLNGGAVHVLEIDDMPEKSSVAAVFRY